MKYRMCSPRAARIADAVALVCQIKAHLDGPVGLSNDHRAALETRLDAAAEELERAIDDGD